MAKTAMITGGGSGIGRATAKALGAEGYQVVVVGRRAERLAETLQAMGPAAAERGWAMPCDVTQPEAVRDLFERVGERYGRLDLLFNNAGTNAPAVPLEELTWEQWQQVVSVNLNATFLCTQQAVALMKRQTPPGGRIINNGSISAHVPRPNSAAYTATKHAVTGLTRSTSLDGRPFQIACGQIDIGNAATDMTARMSQGVRQADGTLAVEPTIDVELVARCVVHMDSLPLDANIPFLTVMANQMPYMGRG